MGNDDSQSPKGDRRAPRPPDLGAAALERAALDYLGRFDSGPEHLRRVLLRRFVRARMAGVVVDQAEAARQVEAVVARLTELGYVDETRFAATKAGSLHRQGRSTMAIRRALAGRGVAAEAAAAAVAELGADPDLAAALALCRRRRLGPFRPPDRRAANRLRDLATLARAGFAPRLAQEVIDGEVTEPFPP